MTITKVMAGVSIALILIGVFTAVIYGNIEEIKAPNIERLLTKLQEIPQLNAEKISELRSNFDEVITGDWEFFEFLRKGLNTIIKFFGGVVILLLNIGTLLWQILIFVINSYQIIFLEI